ncbi:putative sialic acid synthase [Candidatus Planktophila dulcis]|uniref:N-acetylneuraminate synthase family protein n=1 Tax=Candidatus Planktophila dulcis TaxID=1884914 RepID=UPI000BACBF8F|nr:N-acetylneuraminate synthase family protein [Candidatus Planktophila dulcis]ASY14010.1 putative sialic acid synthase [Candidatus Planktophila dulcis]
MQTDSWFSKYKTPNRPLIIADLANNHGGSVELAKVMCQELAELQDESGFRIAMKLQYRNLDTFIAQKYKGDHSFSYIKRFEDTALTWDEFGEITNFAKSLGLLTAATPFDEVSVDYVHSHGHDILKVASASATDWPLLNTICATQLPTIVSTGGLSDKETERVASRFSNAQIDFAIMHCVAIYPTASAQLNLTRISELKEKFRRPTGYSTHEDPADLLAGPLALAAGASILERHYGKSTEKIGVNSYSSERAIFSSWLHQLTETILRLADIDFDNTVSVQKETLRKLQRGVRAAIDIPNSTQITEQLSVFSIPVIGNQLTANDLSIRNRFVTTEDIKAGEEVTTLRILQESSLDILDTIVRETRDTLNLAKIVLKQDQQLEISHHYGIEKFYEYGMVMITQINREYCKKILVLQAGQSHPEHLHHQKEETLILLRGDVRISLDGIEHVLAPGQILVIPRETKHSFYTHGGCVLEEISTQHVPSDSYYSDESINSNLSRKTFSSFWSTSH